LPVAIQFGDKDTQAGCLINLAQVLAAEGSVSEALRSALDSVSVLRTTSSQERLRQATLLLGDLELLAGELDAAQKHYTEAVGTSKDVVAAYSLFGLGNISMARGNLTIARKEHEQALSWRQVEQGFDREIFDSRVRLAELSLEEGRTIEGEMQLRRAVAAYPNLEPDARIQTDQILIRSLLAQNKNAEAKQIASQWQSMKASSEDRFTEVASKVVNAEILSSVARPGEAIDLLETSVREATRYGFVSLQFEARLALSEALNRGGQKTAARAQLAYLERSARAKGFLLIARKASTIRKQLPSS
jgi:tetratricopeptide (TPR) repeat protein